MEIEKYAGEMFAAGSNLKGKSDQEIFYQDFKRFSAGKISFGVAQISSLNIDELTDLKGRMTPFLAKMLEEHKVDMLFFMLTNILTESTELLCEGNGAENLIRLAFHMTGEENAGESGSVNLLGVVSRKKQLIPAIMMACEA